MASAAPPPMIPGANSMIQPARTASVWPPSSVGRSFVNRASIAGGGGAEARKKRGSLTVVAAVGDVSADGNAYLIAGAAAVALVGTAFPILFSRKDTSVFRILYALSGFLSSLLSSYKFSLHVTFIRQLDIERSKFKLSL